MIMGSVEEATEGAGEEAYSCLSSGLSAMPFVVAVLLKQLLHLEWEHSHRQNR